jgi:hypothetical protein
MPFGSRLSARARSVLVSRWGVSPSVEETNNEDRSQECISSTNPALPRWANRIPYCSNPLQAEHLGTGRREFHVGPGFVQPEPAGRNRMREAGAELVRRAALAQETAVDQLDVNATVLDHLDGVRDVHELTRRGADQVRPLIARHAKIRIQAPMKPAMR